MDTLRGAGHKEGQRASVHARTNEEDDSCAGVRSQAERDTQSQPSQEGDGESALNADEQEGIAHRDAVVHAARLPFRQGGHGITNKRQRKRVTDKKKNADENGSDHLSLDGNLIDAHRGENTGRDPVV